MSQNAQKNVLVPVWKLQNNMDESINNCWEVQLRVLTKSKVKEYKGGKLFKVDLQDDLHLEEAQREGHSYQIEATCFKETLDKFFPIFQQGRTFRIQAASIYHANRKFCQIDNDFRLILNSEAEVSLCEEIPMIGAPPPEEDSVMMNQDGGSGNQNNMQSAPKPVPSNHRPKFTNAVDIITYSKTLVKSGILQNEGLPTSPLQLQEVLGLVIEVVSHDYKFRIKDLKGMTIWIYITDFPKGQQLEIERGDVLIVSQGKIAYRNPVSEPSQKIEQPQFAEPKSPGENKLSQQLSQTVIKQGLETLATDAEVLDEWIGINCGAKNYTISPQLNRVHLTDLYWLIKVRQQGE